MSSDAGIAVVRRNTEEVQSRGNFEVFEELFASDFVDHTPQPGGFTRIATALEIYTHTAPHFLIFTLRSIGRFPTGIV
jgi:hypothetical protein